MTQQSKFSEEECQSVGSVNSLIPHCKLSITYLLKHT